MQSEHKTQIYLSKEQYRALRRRAQAEGRSMAAIVRGAVEEYLKRSPGRDAWQADPLGRIVAAGEGSPGDSTSIDELLYGREP
jgi:hypothetical protein